MESVIIPLIALGVGGAMGYMLGRFRNLPKLPERDAKGRFIKRK